MPKLITTPFAVNGQKNEITVNTPESDNSATYDIGFPPITSLPIASGGKPPKGADFNGLFYDITDNISYLTFGNCYVFNAGLSYPLNARINRNDGVRVRSTVANNTTNPNTSMTGWEIDSLSPSQNLLELADKAVARTNLDVYSKAETNAIAGTPEATETTAGKAKIATTEIAQSGVNDTDIMTPKKVKDQVSIGGRVHATAYVSIVGTTVTILGSKNVASVILQSTGVFKVTTLTNMDNLNFTVLLTSSLVNSQGGSTSIIAEWLNADGTNKRTLNSFELVSLGSQGLGNPRYFGVTVIC